MTQQFKPAAPQEVAERVLNAKGGDEDAIEALARRASASAYRTSLVALGDPHAAADVSQETAVRALRGLKGLRDPEKFDAWIYRITIAEIRRSLAKNQRHDHEPLAVHMTAKAEIDGEVVPGSIRMHGGSSVDFRVVDNGGKGHGLPVSYTGRIVLHVEMKNGTLVGEPESLSTKCPSKYTTSSS
jgi:hypothetical protein